MNIEVVAVHVDVDGGVALYVQHPGSVRLVIPAVYVRQIVLGVRDRLVQQKLLPP